MARKADLTVPTTPKKTAAKKAAPIGASAPAARMSSVLDPTGKPYPSVLPKRGPGQSAKARAELMNMLSTVKEPVGTVIANDYQERSFPTRSIVINEVLGIKEIPAHGRMLQVHGEEHSGKSTLLYGFAAAYQEVYGKPVWVWDIEGQVTTDYLWQCGLNPDPSMTMVRNPIGADDILRITIEYMLAGTVDYFIFDSVSHIRPNPSLEDIRKNKALKLTVGEQAKLFKNFLYTLMPYARTSDSFIHFVNQQSCIIPQNNKEAQAMKYATITNWNHTITGGKAARYAPSLMLATAKGKAFEGAKEGIEEWLFASAEGKAGAGKSWDVYRTEVRIVKNKINNGGYRQGNLYLRPGGGIDDWVSVRELAHHYGLISKVSGGYAIGKVESPLASFKTKGEAITELVARMNMGLLLPLRALVVDAIRADDPRKFVYERKQEDLYAAGEIDELGKPVEVDVEDFLGTDDEDLPE